MICVTFHLKKGSDPSYRAPMRSPLPTWQSSNNGLNLQIYGYFNSLTEMRFLYPFAEVAACYDVDYITFIKGGPYCRPHDFDDGKYLLWGDESGKFEYAVPMPKTLINADAKIIAAFRSLFEGYMKLMDALDFRESVARGLPGMLKCEEAAEHFIAEDPLKQRAVHEHIRQSIRSAVAAINATTRTDHSHNRIEPIVKSVHERFVRTADRTVERAELAAVVV